MVCLQGPTRCSLRSSTLSVGSLLAMQASSDALAHTGYMAGLWGTCEIVMQARADRLMAMLPGGSLCTRRRLLLVRELKSS